MFIKFDRSVDSSALQLRRDAAIAKRPLGVQVSDKERDYSGFDDDCEKRTNLEHRREAQETLQQKTMKDKQHVESKYGTRYTELLCVSRTSTVSDRPL